MGSPYFLTVKPISKLAPAVFQAEAGGLKSGKPVFFKAAISKSQ
jgi:hypothetical protein